MSNAQKLLYLISPTPWLDMPQVAPMLMTEIHKQYMINYGIVVCTPTMDQLCAVHQACVETFSETNRPTYFVTAQAVHKATGFNAMVRLGKRYHQQNSPVFVVFSQRWTTELDSTLVNLAESGLPFSSKKAVIVAPRTVSKIVNDRIPTVLNIRYDPESTTQMVASVVKALRQC